MSVLVSIGGEGIALALHRHFLGIGIASGRASGVRGGRETFPWTNTYVSILYHVQAFLVENHFKINIIYALYLCQRAARLWTSH